MPTPLIATGARTPHGSLLGALSDVTALELGSTALSGLIDRASIEADAIDWVAMGHSIQAGCGQVPARNVALDAGCPPETAATTINEASGSGLRAIMLATDRIATGRVEVAIAGGMESMSNAPFASSDHRSGRRHGNSTLIDLMVHDALWDPGYDAHMGELTEALADRFDISRTAQDKFALESHRRAVEAMNAGVFERELVPVETPDGIVDTEEGPRADTSLDQLASLSPAFDEEGTITAGNASDLSDGAGAVLMTTPERADTLGLSPVAEVVDYAVAYRDPKWFGMSVGDAVERLLEKTGYTVEDIDLFELNEAFAAQMCYVQDRLEIPRENLNIRGGAIALGHPIGASGGMLTTMVLETMVDTDASVAVVGMSVGGGGGVAILLRER